MLTIPSHIRVGSLDYTIEYMPAMEASDQDALGMIMKGSCKILLRADLEGWHLLDVLLHEILHAIWYVYRLEDGDKEERMVDTLATAWTQILRDNPKLVSLLVAMLARKASHACG